MFPILNAFLWRLGGSGASPLGTLWRKIGWPVLVLFFGLTHGFAFWRILIAVAIAVFAVTRPITFYGGSIHGHAFNWAWLWVLGLCFCGPMLAFGHVNLWPLAWSLAATLSNIDRTAKTFTWEFCECLAGVTVFL